MSARRSNPNQVKASSEPQSQHAVPLQQCTSLTASHATARVNLVLAQGPQRRRGCAIPGRRSHENHVPSSDTRHIATRLVPRARPTSSRSARRRPGGIDARQATPLPPRVEGTHPSRSFGRGRLRGETQSLVALPHCRPSQNDDRAEPSSAAAEPQFRHTRSSPTPRPTAADQ